MLATLQHFRNPRAPNFKVVLRTCGGKASKKNSHLRFSRVQHASNIEKRGAGGRIDNGATYYVAWPFFEEPGVF